MSGIAAAKKRRAGVTSPMPEPPRLPNGGLPVQTQQGQQQQGLTLQQVISLLDSRITKLEKDTSVNAREYSQTEQSVDPLPSNISEILDDFQQKFIILAGEINSLKDTVLKLQSYTMDVNKILLEERIQIISEIGNTGEDRFLLNSENNSQTQEQPNYSEYSVNENFVFDTLDDKSE